MDFRPNEDDGPTYDVPFHDEARSQDGWQGQGTSLSYDTLKRDVTAVIARLGGVVHSFQRGTYQIGGKDRPGVRVNYSLEGPKAAMIYGRIDVAALPIRPPAKRAGWQQTMRSREDASVRMALYNVIAALRSQWVLKQLNPSYIPLMPWILTKGDKTVSELYGESGYMRALTPPKGEFVEGEFKEAK